MICWLEMLHSSQMILLFRKSSMPQKTLQSQGTSNWIFFLLWEMNPFLSWSPWSPPVILHRLGIICRYEIAAIDLLWHQICTSSVCNECESNRLWSRCQKFWEGDPFLSTPLTIEQRPSFKIFWDFDTAICDTVTLWHRDIVTHSGMWHCAIAPLVSGQPTQ